MFNIKNFDNSIIVAIDSFIPYILNEKQKQPKLDVKVFSLSQMQQMAFGNYITPDSYKIGLKTIDPNYSFLKVLLSYLKKGVDLNIDPKLKKYHDVLNQNSLIDYDENYKYLFINKKVNFIGFDENNNEIKHLIKVLEIKDICFWQLNDLLPNLSIPMTKYKSIEIEIKDALYKIVDLIINQKVSPNDILICADLSIAYYYLKLFATELNLNLWFKDHKTLYDTKIAKEIEDQLDQEDFDLNSFKSKNMDHVAYELIKTIFKDYQLLNLDKKLLKINYRSILKDIKYNIEPKIQEFEAIVVMSDVIFDQNKHIFYLDVTNDHYAQACKDDEYLSDQLKDQSYLTSSNTKNLENAIIYSVFLGFSSKLHLSFAKIDNNTSSVQKESFYWVNKECNKNIKPNEFNENDNYLEYSVSLAIAWMSYYDSMYRTYKENKIQKNIYQKYFLSKIKYFDNQFKQFAGFNNIVKTSYSDINKFYLCPFQYYCEKILKLNEFEYGFHNIKGLLVHNILKQINDDIDFDKAYENAIKDKETKLEYLEYKELLLLKRWIILTKIVWNKLKEQKNEIKSKLTKFITEKEFVKTLPNNKVLDGKIDNILLIEGQSHNFAQIMDYKTGSEKFSKDKQQYGLNLQLPIYAYLLKNDPTFANYLINGCYYYGLKVQSKFECLDYDQKEYDDILKKQIMMSGITNRNYLNLFEPSVLVTKESKYIKEIQLIKGDKISKKFKKNFFDDEKEIYENVETFINFFFNQINKGNFCISPFYDKKNKQEDSGCQYCKYKDICLLNEKQIREQKNLDGLNIVIKSKDDKGEENE